MEVTSERAGVTIPDKRLSDSVASRGKVPYFVVINNSVHQEDAVIIPHLNINRNTEYIKQNFLEIRRRYHLVPAYKNT